ncbi:protein of unknown function [Nannocystis exedens]|uniref:DUF4291 domain-containing protein n=1 Tax=Nannocystis exedens TaxID=54 RepID=A0A1I2EFZ4_9BACT|nr:DUF4291 domain-containing protein [Nannocystis exedens]PCC74752.1 hypothetical protein NAEX_07851 [Nannocystis exedens]SFE91486.1 protein of unknown function [Nannocystis exedens]
MNQIRADFDARTIVVYQAYAPAIAKPAIAAGRFVPPFSRTRMTWIKPSFLWLMARSNWAQKSGQEHVLAVRISRAGWEEALAAGVLTSHVPRSIRDPDEWRERFAAAAVHIQWDPERSLRGADLQQGSIQVGLSRHIIDRFVDQWIVDITDLTPLVRKIHGHLKSGQEARAKALLPPERPYPLSPALARTIGATA